MAFTRGRVYIRTYADKTPEECAIQRTFCLLQPISTRLHAHYTKINAISLRASNGPFRASVYTAYDDSRLFALCAVQRAQLKAQRPRNLHYYIQRVYIDYNTVEVRTRRFV